MKASELRIGNLVNEEVLGNCVITQITSNSVWVRVNNIKTDGSIGFREFHLYIENIQPIPLTEEWLEKCILQFKELGHNDLSVSRGLSSGDFHFVCGNYYIKIDFLHELQNLYLIFTNKELTIIS